MSANIVPLNNKIHSTLRVKPQVDVAMLKEQHILPLVVHEFVRAATNFPIVFVKNTDTGQFQAVAMLGLKPGENLYVDGDTWAGTMVPGIMTNAPLKIVFNEEDNQQFMLGINMNSVLVGEEEGELLFTKDGKETKFLEARKQNVLEYYESTRLTETFINEISKLDVLETRSLNVEFGDEKLALDGMYFVNEEKMNALSDEVFKDLRKKGFLLLIHAHLISLSQMQRLTKMKLEKQA